MTRPRAEAEAGGFGVKFGRAGPITRVPRPVTRRAILSGGLTIAAAFSTGVCHLRASQPVQVGLTPVFLTNDLELLSSLRSYLSRAWRRDVQLVTRRTYQEITTLLLAGQIDAAWICGYPYVQFRERLDLLAVPVWQGQPLYRSYVIVDASREAEYFKDLKGDVHAFSDPDSNSGFLVTRDLLADLRTRPETFFRHSFYTYGHRDVVRAVASGLAQSGSVDGYVWEVLAETEPALTARTRVLRRSELLGFPPIASGHNRLGGLASAELAKAFLEMSQDGEGKRVLAALRLDGFTPGDPSLFDTIAAKVEHVRRVG
jgi:phosphonate transport system substrate-binding protein